jgi:mRNA-degrading endonuclease RelE of RelBE toxin-antitoxin system
MSPDHAPFRAQIVFSELAQKQVDALTAAETHALDRAVVALSVDPTLGAPTRHPLLRDYRDPIEDVRIIYYVTVPRGTIVVIGYVEA